MNPCAVQQQNAFAACDEMRSSVSVSVYDRRETVVCPIRPLRWQLSHPTELCESKAGTDLLDILLPKKRLEDVSIPTHLDKSDDPRADSAPEVCIDAGSTGNIARFINHSCQPNLFVQCVLSTHHDIKLARVVLFAADNIPPQKILSLHMIMVIHLIVSGPDGKITQMACYCGAADCWKLLL